MNLAQPSSNSFLPIDCFAPTIIRNMTPTTSQASKEPRPSFAPLKSFTTAGAHDSSPIRSNAALVTVFLFSPGLRARHSDTVCPTQGSPGGSRVQGSPGGNPGNHDIEPEQLLHYYRIILDQKTAKYATVFRT